MKRARFAGGLTAVLVVAFLVAGCGSDDSSDQGSDDSSSADIDLNALYEGTYGEPPSSAPDHQAGKKVTLISCGQSIPYCASVMAGAEAAAESLGWDASIVDSQGDPTVASQGIRQAIAANADGIFVNVLDCEYIKQPLQEANDAGIPVVAAESRDCNQDLGFKPTDGPQLFTSVVSYENGPVVDWLTQIGEFQAQYLLAKQSSELNIASFFFSDVAASLPVEEGFVNTINDACDSCEVTEVTYTLAEAAESLQEKAQQALIKAPGVNAIRTDSDGTWLAGVNAAAQATVPDARVMLVEGQEAILDLVRDGQTNLAGTGITGEWEGWAGIDGLLRALADAPAESSGIGNQIWDADHNVPASGPWAPPVDFQAKYLQAWGVE